MSPRGASIADTGLARGKQHDITLGSVPGREFTVTSTVGARRMTTRLYLDHDRLYMVGMLANGAATPPLPLADYFAGFKLIPASSP